MGQTISRMAIGHGTLVTAHAVAQKSGRIIDFNDHAAFGILGVPCSRRQAIRTGTNSHPEFATRLGCRET